MAARPYWSEWTNEDLAQSQRARGARCDFSFICVVELPRLSIAAHIRRHLSGVQQWREVLMFAPCARCTHDRVQTLRVLGHHLLKLRNALCAPKHHHLHLSRKRNRKLHGQIVATTHKG